MTSTDAFRSWAEIDTAALRHNARIARERAGTAAALLAVVKANAYGHGLAGVAEALAGDAQLFGVANLREAIQAREVIPQPVLIMGPALPAERAEIVARRFIASVSSSAEAAEFSEVARGQSVAVNCTVDTGMGRMGMHESDAVPEVKRIAELPNVRIHSISTHLPAGDEDAEFTRTQLSRFDALMARIRSEMPGDYLIHALPSAGVISFSDSAYDAVRAGLMLYGISPMPEFQKTLRPALTLKARVVLVRDLPAGASISYGRTFITQRPIRVATLGVGYADGLPRAISNRGAAVLIGGQRCAVLGRVTMDLTVVDVTHLPEVQAGDEVVLIGRQGREEILATEVAKRASTIAWEIFTGIGTRVARVYL